MKQNESRRTLPDPLSIQSQRILVPTDLSGYSFSAVQYAAALAREFGAGITLLHVVQLNIGGEELGIPRTQWINEMGEAARVQLRALASEVCGHDLPTQIVIAVGRPHLEILDQARELNADLIIMATHGYTGLLRLLRPNTTAHVVRDAPCPVLVVRAHQHGFLQETFSRPRLGSDTASPSLEREYVPIVSERVH